MFLNKCFQTKKLENVATEPSPAVKRVLRKHANCTQHDFWWCNFVNKQFLMVQIDDLRQIVKAGKWWVVYCCITNL